MMYVIMSTDENSDNDVNETRSNNGEGTIRPACRYPAAEQRISGRYATTAKVKWNKKLNKIVMESYLTLCLQAL